MSPDLVRQSANTALGNHSQLTQVREAMNSRSSSVARLHNNLNSN